MKKMVSLLLAAVLAAGTLSACKKNDPEPAESSQPEPEQIYQDGDYPVSYTVPALDRTMDFITLSIKDGQIEISDYGCREDNSIPADSANEGSTSSDAALPSVPETASSEAASSEAAASGHEGATEYEMKALLQMDEIVDEFNAVGHDVEKMELIEGTDEHFYRFQRMVREALEAAKTGDTQEIKLGKYADGDYEAVMPEFNAAGWKEYIRLTVKDSQITDIEFNATKQDDSSVLITEDPEQNPQGQSDTPADYYPAIAQSFTEAGEDLNNLTAPTNGTAAFKAFSKLMKPLLASMISGGEKNIVAPMYVDGTYKAQMKEFDEYGWKDYIVLNIKNDQVTIEEYDAFSQADETKLKSQDSELASSMKEKSGTDPAAASKQLIDNFEKAGGDPYTMDSVAGATVSSNTFRLMVAQILATSAVEGDTENTLEIEPFPAEL